MGKRKTFDIAELTTMVNDICQYSVNESKDIRRGAMNVLEEVLHRTGNYKGFRYLSKDYMEAGYTVGINLDPNGEICKDYNQRFAGTDDTRVEYYQ